MRSRPVAHGLDIALRDLQDFIGGIDGQRNARFAQQVQHGVRRAVRVILDRISFGSRKSILREHKSALGRRSRVAFLQFAFDHGRFYADASPAQKIGHGVGN